MTPERIIEILSENNPDSLLADNLDDALVGHTVGFKTLAVYDVDKCLDIFMTRDGMTYEEAVEFFDFNVSGAYMGENTPIFVTFPKDDEL